jgi:hypothetical protein
MLMAIRKRGNNYEITYYHMGRRYWVTVGPTREEAVSLEQRIRGDIESVPKIERSHDLFYLFRTAKNVRGNDIRKITQNDVIEWATSVVKVAMEYYNAEIEDCMDPDCSVCVSMQKLGRLLGGNVKFMPEQFKTYKSWNNTRVRRNKKMGIETDHNPRRDIT